MNGPNQDVPSREGNLPNTEPQAPRSIPLSEIQKDKTGGGDRAGNQSYNGSAANSRMRTRERPIDPPQN